MNNNPYPKTFIKTTENGCSTGRNSLLYHWSNWNSFISPSIKTIMLSRKGNADISSAVAIFFPADIKNRKLFFTDLSNKILLTWVLSLRQRSDKSWAGPNLPARSRFSSAEGLSHFHSEPGERLRLGKRRENNFSERLHLFSIVLLRRV